MNGWLLDTNVISEVSGAKPDPKVARWIEALPEHTLYLSILTIGEYQKGIQHLSPGDKLRPRLQRSIMALEARFSGRILSVSDQIVLRWGAISGEGKRLTGHSPQKTRGNTRQDHSEHGMLEARRGQSAVQ